MSLVLLVAALWLTGLTALVTVCRAAAQGDMALRTQLSGHDSHERPLAA